MSEVQLRGLYHMGRLVFSRFLGLHQGSQPVKPQNGNVGNSPVAEGWSVEELSKRVLELFDIVMENPEFGHYHAAK